MFKNLKLQWKMVVLISLVSMVVLVGAMAVYYYQVKDIVSDADADGLIVMTVVVAVAVNRSLK